MSMDRYGVNYVGGGWDLAVVFDATMWHYASAHCRDNWIATFPDSLVGFQRAHALSARLNLCEEWAWNVAAHNEDKYLPFIRDGELLVR